MKKTIITDVKRIIAVCMAVLMLMTVWVFVAPEKAEAVTGGSYSYKVTAEVTNSMDNCEMAFNLYGKPDNGAGTEAQIDSTSWNNVNRGEQTYTLFESTSSSFPTRLWVHDRSGAKYHFGRDIRVKFHIYIGGTEVGVTGSKVSSSGVKSFDISGNELYWDTDYNVTSGKANYYSANFNVNSGNYPYVNSAEIYTNGQPSNIQIPKDPTNGSYAKSTTFKTYALDQYGVRLATGFFGSNYTPSVTVTFNNPDYTGRAEDETTGHGDWSTSVSNSNGSYDQTTFTVNRRLQTEDTLTCTLAVSYTKGSNTRTATSNEFTITDPKYTQTIKSNDGQLYSSEEHTDEKKIDNDSSYQFFYYNDIGSISSYNDTTTGKRYGFPVDGVLTGYTFQGMYTTNNAKKTGIAYWQTENGVPVKDENGKYISTWTPSGTKLVSDHKVEKNNTWYAAWQANPVKVTVNDYRGVGRVFYGTYGQTINAITNSYMNNTTIAPAEYTKNTYKYQRTGWQIIEKYNYTLDGTQAQDFEATYSSVAGTANVYGDITIEPVYEIEGTYIEYTVNFHNTDGTTTTYSDYRYGDDVTERTVPTQTKAADDTYTYDFAGWTQNAPASGNYHMYDSAEEAAEIVEGFARVTGTQDYYPVWYRTYKTYTVNFVYVPDGTAASDANASGNFVDHKNMTYHWGDPIVVPNLYTPGENNTQIPFSYTFDGVRHKFTGWDVTPAATCNGNLTYTAVYNDTETAVYTIKFVDNRIYGTTEEPFVIKEFTGIEHHSDLDLGDFDLTTLASADKEDVKDIDGYRNTFQGYTTSIRTDDITSDATYVAKWSRKIITTVQFYNGDSYISGADITGIEGDPVAYGGETPSKPHDKIADAYTFAGWQDANGNTVESIPADVATIKLYAKYDITYHNYTIKFLNDQGDTILEKTDYHYNDVVTEPTAEQRAKPKDNMYNYTFTRWDKDVGRVTDDATYTAIYLSNYNYYDVTWLNDDGSTYSTGKYMYNERISAPFDEPAAKRTYQDPPEGYTIGFLGWKHNENNVEGDFYSRSDRCGTEGAVYIAVFGNVADLKTITFYDETGTGDPLGTATVEYNSTLKANEAKIPTAKKNATEEKHFTFDKWVNLDGSAYNDEAAITTDISLKASFTAADHTFKPKKVTTAPTFTTSGQAIEACETCGFERNVEVAKLADTIAPTVKLMVRDLSWESVDSDAAIHQVAPSNLLAIATKDTADVNTNYNPSGDGSLVQTIDVVIMKEDSVREINQIGEGEWFNSYTRPENDTGNANTADILKLAVEQINEAQDYNIEHGDKFVIYVRATDLMGNTTYVRSGVLQYDTQAPDLNIGLEDEFYNNNRTIFCGAATIVVDTDATAYTLTINGTAVTPTNNKYRLGDAGFYAVTVRDVAGNSVTKNIEIKADHSYNPVTIAPSCTVAGSTYNVCSICGNKTTATPLEALGHDEVEVVVAPTCAADGYTYKYCRRCNDKIGENYNIVAKFDHTYPNDAEAYGENAGQTAWQENTYLRKNATCSAEGSAYYVCQLCGEQKIEILSIDANAHSYYRGVTTDPDCTHDGFITYTCKYNSSHVKTITPADGEEYAYLAKTGHTPGEWKVTTEATCAAAGSKVQICAVCGAELEDTRTEIPALEPQWVATVTPPGDGTPGYTTYTCAGCGGTVAGHETYTGDYVDPLTKVTIKFVDEDGTTVATFEKLKGESIAESAVAAPTKSSDNTYNYTFAGWKDANDEAVTFPITAGDTNATYTATYTSRYINYTLILNRPAGSTDTVFKKLGYQHNDDSTIDLSVGPNKDSSNTTDYTFDGWYYKYDVDGVMTDSDVFTTARLSDLIAAGIFNENHEATLYPHYKETARQYTVVFGYNPESILATVTVGYGETAVYPDSADEPEKDYDELGHYVWAGSWSTELTNVTQNLFVKPIFNKVSHNYTTTVIEREGAAKCTEPEQTTYTCACGYSYTSTTATAPGHTWSEGTDGHQTCTVCGTVRDDETLYTVIFMDDGVKVKSYNLKYGESITKPVDPIKAADDQFTYAFEYWYTTDENTAVAVAETCTGNITYTAKFKATARTFSVAFGYDANNILKTYTGIPYGGSVTYDGPTPVKAPDAKYHYTFTGWDKDYSAITRDLTVYAVFDKVGHSFSKSETDSTAPSCEQAGVDVFKCAHCTYSYTSPGGSALGHNWVEQSRTDTQIIYKCTRCDQTKTEERTDVLVNLTITVKDSNHNPVSGANVRVYDGNTQVASGTTDGDGKVTVRVPGNKTYRIEIDGSGINGASGTITVDQYGNITSGSVPTVSRIQKGCDCTCHKSGLWPTIFRFFHKIIKMITGEFRCCPDANY